MCIGNVFNVETPAEYFIYLLFGEQFTNQFTKGNNIPQASENSPSGYVLVDEPKQGAACHFSHMRQQLRLIAETPPSNREPMINSFLERYITGWNSYQSQHGNWYYDPARVGDVADMLLKAAQLDGNADTLSFQEMMYLHRLLNIGDPEIIANANGVGLICDSRYEHCKRPRAEIYLPGGGCQGQTSFDHKYIRDHLENIAASGLTVYYDSDERWFKGDDGKYEITNFVDFKPSQYDLFQRLPPLVRLIGCNDAVQGKIPGYQPPKQ